MTLSVPLSFMLHLNVVETIQATRITPFFFVCSPWRYVRLGKNTLFCR